MKILKSIGMGRELNDLKNIDSSCRDITADLLKMSVFYSFNPVF